MNAVDLETGEPVWRSRVQLEDVVQTPVAVDETSAYIGDVGGRVTVVDLESGDVRWTKELGTPIAGAVTLDAGRVLVTTLGGQDDPSEIVALDDEKGTSSGGQAPKMRRTLSRLLSWRTGGC